MTDLVPDPSTLGLESPTLGPWFSTDVTLNRKDFGIDIDMPLETGGAVVGDKVTITLEIEALKQG